MGIVIRKTISTSIINYIGVMLGVVNVLWLQTAFITELQIGILSYITDVTILLLPFILLGTSGLPGKFLHLFEKNKERNQFISFLFLVPIILLLFVCIVVFFFKSSIISLLGDDAIKYSEFLIFIIPLLFCYGYQYLIESILVSKSLIVYSSFLKNIYRRVILMLLLILYSFNYFDFFQLIYIYVIAHFIEVILLYLFFKNQIEFNFNFSKLHIEKPLKKEIISYAFYLIIGISGLVMVGKIDSVMISSITDDFKLLGVYAVAFFIATVIDMPKRIIYQIVLPIMAKLWSENNLKEFESMYKRMGISMSIIGIFLFFLIWYSIDELFLMIPNGEIYVEGKWVVFYIGLSKLMDAIFIPTDININASKHYKWNGVLIPFLILTTFITNYYFINNYGIVGASIATAVTVFLYSIVKYIVVIIKLKMNLLSREHLKIIFTSLIIIALFWFKPRILDNNFFEIALNSILITIIFIGGNFVLKSSTEMNELMVSNYKKLIGKK
ncbi:MAG: oligosaccharide flippase family protein [Flavobacteriales bacterium]|nr:oligosaccharide flippase family protein [Flavobacteriales bacterium]